MDTMLFFFVFVFVCFFGGLWYLWKGIKAKEKRENKPTEPPIARG